MDREVTIIILLALIIGTVIVFITGAGYEQMLTKKQICLQISSTLAQYGACINLDYDKVILSLKDGKVVIDMKEYSNKENENGSNR